MPDIELSTLTLGAPALTSFLLHWSSTASTSSDGRRGTLSEVGTLLAGSGDIKTALDLKAPLASPSLTGVPTAPTAASGTSTTQLATTAFVTAYGGAFDVNADTEITPSTAILMDQATGNEVGLTLSYTTNKATSGTDTGLLINKTDTASPGVSALADFQTGGSSKFFVSDGGNVGIGTASPGAKLDIQTGLINIKTGASVTNASYTGINLYSGNVSYGALLKSIQGATTTRHGMSFWTSLAAASAERMRITDAGNVGIGTTSPNDSLTVNGTLKVGTVLDAVVSGNQIEVEQSSGNAGIRSYSSDVTSYGSVVASANGASMNITARGTSAAGTLFGVAQADTAQAYSVGGVLMLGTYNDNDIIIGQNNAEVARFQGGNVGIGTTTPDGLLHALKTGTFDPTLSGSSSVSSLIFENGDGTDVGLYGGINWFKRNSAGVNGAFISAYNLDSGADTGLALGTHGATAMLINEAGNVGIGTTSPLSKQHIVGAKGSLTSITAFQMGLIVDDNATVGAGTGGGISFRALRNNAGSVYSTLAAIDGFKQDAVEGQYNGSLRFLTASSAEGYPLERVRITSTGNVGIGTTSPDTLLDISADTNPIMSITSEGEARFQIGVDSAADILVLGDRSSSGFAFRTEQNFADITSGTDRLFIGTNGNVGIGTASPNANALLDITSTTKAFMPPRMTTTQKNAVASPTAGMVVYDSTLSKLAVYTGAAWEAVTSV